MRIQFATGFIGRRTRRSVRAASCQCGRQGQESDWSRWLERTSTYAKGLTQVVADGDNSA